MKGAGRGLLLQSKHQNLKYETHASCFLNTGIHIYGSILTCTCLYVLL